MTDWDRLVKKTSTLTTREVVKESDGSISSLTVSGLRFTLSGLVKELPKGGALYIAAFADTFVIDQPVFPPVKGLLIVARSLDVSGLRGKGWPMRLPAIDYPTEAQFLIGGTLGGVFRVTTEQAKNGVPSVDIPAGTDPLGRADCALHKSGKLECTVRSTKEAIADLTGRSWALGSLKSSVTAAGYLMDTGKAQDATLARSMLTWVIACVEQAGAEMPSKATAVELAELARQATALLVGLNVPPGTHYVPVLEADFYKRQAAELVKVLESYQHDVRELTTAKDLREALRKVSATLGKNAKTETGPLKVRLNEITAGLQHLEADIRALRHQIHAQFIRVDSAFSVMRAAISQGKIQDFVDAYFNTMFDVVKLGVSAMEAYKDPKKIPDAAEKLYRTSRQAYDLISSMKDTGPGSDGLLEAAQQLLRSQERLIASYESAAALWHSGGKDGLRAPKQLKDGDRQYAADPSLAWDVYLVKAQAVLSKMSQRIGSGKNSGPAQDAATDYLAEIQILGRYGKALAVTVNAFATQLAEGGVVRSQIKAAEEVAERWRKLSDSARTDQERISVLLGILQSRMSNVKRSLHVAWTYYRDAWFYLYFEKPPALDLDASIPDIRRALADVTGWVERLVGQQGSKRIQLPGKDTKVKFTLRVVQAGSRAKPRPGELVAVLGRNTDNRWVLNWSVPIDNTIFKGVLPGEGNVATWIKRAEFFVEGAKPNDRGNIITKIATSGCYQNGYGPKHAYSFVTKPLAGAFAYDASGKVYTPWKIEGHVYMTPNLCTQWSMTFEPDGGDPSQATQVKANLLIDFREKPTPGQKASPEQETTA
ncbi:hypothetical protein ACFY2W_32800 [Streptomyces sp. NPDC001262]|uniref:hypothetical protein n=1 Tax=Streptomyces sp. NPDC001262 TaxID=3364552 RepID=UPI0036CF8145